jgi:hypothetical protein
VIDDRARHVRPGLRPGSDIAPHSEAYDPPAHGNALVHAALLTGLLLPIVMVVLGAAMVVRALTGGGGPLALGVILGLLFVAAGIGRLYVERRSA